MENSNQMCYYQKQAKQKFSLEVSPRNRNEC